MKYVFLTSVALASVPALAQLPPPSFAPELSLAPEVTVSGVSSGGYMAAQYHLAFAEQVSGAAIIAAGPIYCAQNSLQLAFAQCLGQPALPPAQALLDYITLQQQQGELAPVSALANDKVWLFHGSKDQTVHPQLSVALAQQYQQWLPAEQIALVNDKPFAHHFPTNKSGLTDCHSSDSPFIASCDYDAAGQLLQHLYGALNAAASQTSGTVHAIDQHQVKGAAKAQLAKTGYLYVPASCSSAQPCRLHISFHGCRQNAEMVADAYITQTGLNEYADTNQLVVFYPQITASKLLPMNPQACWDWWGYSGDDYMLRSGAQLSAVQQLTQRLISP
ncbi:extracellular catalytic domain type 2 short-chain-length polyhydroxyalkanoate depolymerase [Arsukibacterium sp.]|uniref:extracellular catalytic domain type 2 short-chain-length polyhydroxyalkanoate depolymerase n=1 Tax=Arsukibacterium sp. TaxID=1977258 RepID=UPI002FD968AA